MDPVPKSARDGAWHFSYYTSSGVRATYAFDARGQRVRSVVTSGSVTTTTTWAYEGLTLLSLFATRGAEAWSVTYLSDDAGRAYAGLYREGTSATPFLLSTSDRGDVIALTDVSGVPFASHRYDPWGVITSSLTTATASMDASLAARIAERQPLRYAGYVHDAESRMYYCSARTYDPTTRQFLSKDPAKDDGEESAYQYCGGDPVGKVDPSGEFAIALVGVPVIVWVAIAAAIVMLALPPDIKNEVAWRVDRALKQRVKDAGEAVKKLKKRFPKDKWTIHVVVENRRATNYPRNLKGSKKDRTDWTVKHAHNRPHYHIEIRRNGKFYWRSPSI